MPPRNYRQRFRPPELLDFIALATPRNEPEFDWYETRLGAAPFPMHNVKIKKSELLKKLTANRARHADLFAEAGFRRKVLALFLKLASDAKQNKKISLAAVRALTQPTNHLTDYDRALAMLRMSVDDVIELTAENFAELVLDEWGWRQSWKMSNSVYSSKIAKF